MEFRKSISRAARKGLIQLGLTGCGLALCVCAAFAQPFQLAQPVLLNDTPFFTDSVVIRMHFDLEGAEIRYTLDGKQPDRHSALYTGPITMHERCVLLAKAFHPDFQASEARIMSFIKVDAAYLPVKAELLFGPSPKYPGQGAATLMDLEKGHADFSDLKAPEPAKNWWSVSGGDKALDGNAAPRGVWGDKRPGAGLSEKVAEQDPELPQTLPVEEHGFVISEGMHGTRLESGGRKLRSFARLAPRQAGLAGQVF